ncbi:MAG TPA: amino acid adenylation domain-containing protein [Burkholderiaceae bacterium]|nr:amino acid adenylation domain-containing protein [Burkholderiaceae bacterium]
MQANPAAVLRPIEDAYPLTRMQQALLMRCLAYPDQPLYMGQWWAVLEGALDAAALAAAWQQVVDRHTALRSGFHWDLKDHPFQVVHRQAALAVDQLDWTSCADWRLRLDDYLAQDRARPFDIRKPPLMRVALLRLAADRHVLVWTRHHLTVDGWSLGIILDEVFALYRSGTAGTALSLAPAPAYRRYVDWEKSRDPAAAIEYWRDVLASMPESGGAGSVSSADAASPVIRAHRIHLPAALANRLEDFARTAHVTVNTLVQAAWALVQARLQDSATVIFGAVEALRPSGAEGGQLAGLVGIQIQIQPVVAQVDERPLGDWLRALQKQAASARDAGSIGMDDLRALLDMAPDVLPFDSLVGFQNYPLDEEGALAGTGLALAETGDVTLPDMPLNLMVERHDGGLAVHLMVDERHVAAADAALRMDMLAHTLGMLPASADLAVDRIDAVPPVIAKALLDCSVGIPQTRSADTTVIEDILAHAMGQPDAPALVHGAESLTYAALLGTAARIALRLRAAGIERGHRVAIHLERSPLGIAALLGTLMSGAAYVPLDVNSPAERKRYIASQAEAAAVIGIGEPGFAGPALVDVEDLADFSAADAGTALREAAAAGMPQGQDEAYVIFTSGSTGRPKGVSVTHGNLAYHVAARMAAYPDRPNRRLLLTFPLIFDGSVTGIFGTLAIGGTLVLPRAIEANDPDRLAALIRSAAVSQTIMIPSQWSLVLSAGEAADFATLQLAVVAGEACPPDLVERHCAKLRHLVLANEYGPTETTVWATWESCRPGGAGGPVPIGRPIPGTRTYVVDSRNRLCPAGVPGELWIAGPGVAQGYVGQAALTSERFVLNPFHDDPGYDRAYRSGDRVVLGHDGKLRFQGRADEQVKISGYRIELAEIEARMRDMAGVEEAVVLALRQGGQTAQLIAHAAGAHVPGSEAVLQHLQGVLPAYMVPQHIVLHEKLPRTSAGKVDRLKLPEPQRLQGASAPPQGKTECDVAMIWQAVLGCAAIGRHDNFFAIGGRSLDAMQMVSRLRRDLKLAVELIDLFEAPVLSDFAQRLSGREAGQEPGLRKRTRTRVDLSGGAPSGAAQ